VAGEFQESHISPVGIEFLKSGDERVVGVNGGVLAGEEEGEAIGLIAVSGVVAVE